MTNTLPPAASPGFSFAYRSNDGIGLAQFPETYRCSAENLAVKMCQFAPNGLYYAWVHVNGLSLIHNATPNIIHHCITRKNLIDFRFSPQATYISTFEKLLKEPPAEDPQNEPHRNVRVYNVLTGQLVCAFSHKNPDSWLIQWTEDEKVFGRMSPLGAKNNEVLFYASSAFDKVAAKLQLEGITTFSISPGRNPCVAAFVPEVKGKPAIVRLYGLMSFNYPLSNKTFFNADTVTFMWNKIGTNVLVLTHTDTDKTGQSYYGETHLYYLSAVGNYDCRVEMDAAGPIHDIAWSPNSQEFVVVYGNMPAKAALFDSRANKVFDFGASAKNMVRFSPQGRMVLLAGFGNLAGYVEVWDRKRLLKLSTFKEDAAVYCEFAPDAVHILTATLSPRLRVDNRFRVRDYWGQIKWEKEYKELFQVALAPNQPGVNEDGLTLRICQADVLPTTNGTTTTVKKGYVPPHLRNRENKPAVPGASVPGAPPKQHSNGNTKGTKRPNPPTQSPAASPLPSATSEKEQLEKQTLAIQRKLRKIQDLKDKLAAGETLEKNQLDKLQTESGLESELAQVQARLDSLS